MFRQREPRNSSDGGKIGDGPAAVIPPFSDTEKGTLSAK